MESNLHLFITNINYITWYNTIYLILYLKDNLSYNILFHFVMLCF